MGYWRNDTIEIMKKLIFTLLSVLIISCATQRGKHVRKTTKIEVYQKDSLIETYVTVKEYGSKY